MIWHALQMIFIDVVYLMRTHEIFSICLLIYSLFASFNIYAQ